MIELDLKSVYVEITNKCNLHCKHCYNDSKFQNNIFLGTSAIEKLYQTLSENKINPIAISGGEPLLHPNILTILKFSTLFETQTQLITNGVLLNKYCDYINNAPNIMLQLSIDGYGKTHDLLRGNGVFEIVNANLNELNNNVNLSMKCTINSFNISQIETIIQYAIDKGAHTIAFSTLCNQGRSVEFQEIHVSANQLKKTIDNISELSEKYKDYIEVKNMKINYSHCPFCSSGQIDVSPRIDPLGNVYLCSMFTNPMFKIGNIYDDDLISILKSERCINMVSFMRSFRNILDCSNCLLNGLCQKGCLAQYLNNMVQYQDDMCDIKKNDFCRFLNNHIV